MMVRPAVEDGQEAAADGQAPAPALPNTPARLRRQRFWSCVFLCVWLALAIWSAFRLATAWPYTTSFLFTGLFVALPGLVFRSFDLAYMQMRKRRLGGWWRTLARVLAIPLGFMLAPLDALDRSSMARFEQALAPLLAQIQTNAASACTPKLAYNMTPALLEYMDDAQALRRPADLHYGGGRFVLALLGRTAGFDGSTIHYDSQARTWQKFPNDVRDASDAFATLVKGMETCKIDLR